MIEVARSLEDYRIHNGRIVGKLPSAPFQVVLKAEVNWPKHPKRIMYQDISQSFVKNFALMLYSFMSTVTTSFTSQTNTSISHNPTLSENYDPLNANAAAGASGTSAMGIQVGTGTAAPAPADYFLQTAIAHGSGAGQLQYAIQNFTAVTVSGQVSSWTLWRTFTNASGATISPTESIISVYIVGNAAYFCIAHDTFSAITILNTQVLTLTYTLSVTT